LQENWPAGAMLDFFLSNPSVEEAAQY